MLAEWTPARAIVASVLDENLSRIEAWFSSWTLNKAINAAASVNYSLVRSGTPDAWYIDNTTVYVRPYFLIGMP